LVGDLAGEVQALLARERRAVLAEQAVEHAQHVRLAVLGVLALEELGADRRDARAVDAGLELPVRVDRVGRARPEARAEERLGRVAVDPVREGHLSPASALASSGRFGVSAPATSAASAKRACEYGVSGLNSTAGSPRLTAIGTIASVGRSVSTR